MESSNAINASHSNQFDQTPKKDVSSELTIKNIKNYESDSEIICDEEEIDRL